MDSIPVGVVIPAFNAEQFLRHVLQSVRDQSKVEWHAVLVDDGSTDNTFATAREFEREDERLHVVRQPNSGRAVARNRGEQLLPDSVKYVMFVDADDVLDLQCLGVLSSYLDQNPHVGAVGCQFRPIDELGRLICTKGLPREKAYRTRWVPGLLGIPRELRPHEKFTPFITFFTGSGVGPHAMFRREVFRKVQGYDPLFDGREDQDLFRKVALEAPIHFIPEALYFYRRHPAQSINNHRKFADEGGRLDAKWSTYKPADASRAQLLREAQIYLRTVHEPMRKIRTAIRALRSGRTSGALNLFVQGSITLLTGWPRYIAFHHQRTLRNLNEAQRPKPCLRK